MNEQRRRSIAVLGLASVVAVDLDGRLIEGSAAPCSTEPRSSVRRPPMRSQIAPETRRLTTPEASISDSIWAPRAAP